MDIQGDWYVLNYGSDQVVVEFILIKLTYRRGKFISEIGNVVLCGVIKSLISSINYFSSGTEYINVDLEVE